MHSLSFAKFLKKGYLICHDFDLNIHFWNFLLPFQLKLVFYFYFDFTCMKFLFSHIYLTYVNTACKPYVSQVSTFFFFFTNLKSLWRNGLHSTVKQRTYETTNVTKKAQVTRKKT